ncbi:MAG: hypothetical protein AAFU85_15405, partial [Planctomycetota bacterium]
VEKQITDFDKKIAEVDSEFDDKIRDFDSKSKDFEEKGDELRLEISSKTDSAISASIEQIQTFKVRLLDSNVTANKLLTEIGVGQSYLYQRHSPKDALSYAKRAEDTYDDFIKRTPLEPTAEKDAVQSIDVIKQIGPLLFSLLAEAAWQSENLLELEKASSRLSNMCDGSGEDCWRIEYERFAALAELSRAVKLVDVDRTDDRRRKMEVALSRFEKFGELVTQGKSEAQESNPRAVSLMFSGLISLDLRDEHTAKDAFEKLASFAGKDRERLPTDVRSRIDLSIAFHWLCKILCEEKLDVPLVEESYEVMVPYTETVEGDDGKPVDVTKERLETRTRAVPAIPSFTCTTGLQILDLAESHLIEKILIEFRKSINERSGEDWRRTACDRLTGQVISALQNACAKQGGCAECG